MEMVEREELKPCPFCGGEAIENEQKNGAKINKLFWVIQCKNCYASIAGTHRRVNRESWNRMADDEKQNNDNP